MNKDQFIYWLKGFARAVNEEGPTPKQWEIIVSELDKIKDCPDFGSPIGEKGWGTPNTAPIQTSPFIQPADRINPYKITSATTGESGVVLTTTPNIGGTITYNPSTTTIWNPSGSNWSYTTTLQGVTGSNGPDDSGLNEV